MTGSDASAALGIFHGAYGIACSAGRAPSRISLKTEGMQIPNRRATSRTPTVGGAVSCAANAGIPRRSLTSRTLTDVQFSELCRNLGDAVIRRRPALAC
jgi:hypothetical protein